MGKAIVIGSVIIILALLAVGYAIYLHMSGDNDTDGGLNLKEQRELRQLVDKAARIMLQAGTANTIEDSDVLSHRTATAMDAWLHAHNEFMRKDINA